MVLTIADPDVRQKNTEKSVLCHIRKRNNYSELPPVHLDPPMCLHKQSF